jgi:outer membrane scaffolding protein for murein synthesis (MipA/OmpV family)
MLINLGDLPMKAVFSSLTCLVMIVLSPYSSWAEDSGKFSVGIAYINGSSIYSNTKASRIIMPSLSYETDKISANVQNGFTYKIISNQSTKLNVSLAPNFKPYNSNDSNDLIGMKRNMYIDGLISVSRELSRGLSVKLNVATELTDRFNGSAANVSLSQFIPINSVPFIFSIGSSWYDQKRANYLYGVYSTEATGQRAKYELSNVFVPYISINTFYSISENTRFFAGLNANFLSNEITNSPIVSKKNKMSVIMGLTYNLK